MKPTCRFAVVTTTLLCVLLSGCSLFRSKPKTEETIQNPPPIDNNYIACRVDGETFIPKNSISDMLLHPAVRHLYLEAVLHADNRIELYMDAYKGDTIRLQRIRLSHEYRDVNDASIKDWKPINGYAIYLDLKGCSSVNETFDCKLQDLEGYIRLLLIDLSKKRVTGEFKFSHAKIFSLETVSDTDRTVVSEGVFSMPLAIINK